MRREPGLLALFAEPVEAAEAIRSLRRLGLEDVRVAMPAPFPEVMEALQLPRSRVGVGVLLSTAAGLLAGFALCIGTSLAWPLVVGGKPIVALPAFTVIAFECAVLVGGMTTHAMLAYATATGRWRRAVPIAEPRFTVDRIGVYVPGEDQAVGDLLRRSGAEEVRRVA